MYSFLLNFSLESAQLQGTIGEGSAEGLQGNDIEAVELNGRERIFSISAGCYFEIL